MDKQVNDEFSSQPSQKLPKKNRLSRSKTPKMPISRGPTAEYDHVDVKFSDEIYSTPPILPNKNREVEEVFLKLIFETYFLNYSDYQGYVGNNCE